MYHLQWAFTPTAALSRIAAPGTSRFKSVEQFWTRCHPLTAKRCQSCVPQRRPPLPLNQFQGRQSAQNTMRKDIWHQFGLTRSAFLAPRLPPLKILRSFHQSASNPTLYATQSSIRHCLKHRKPHLRTQAIAYNPTAILLQPLDPSCHYQSVRRGFATSLPILIVYLLLYLLNFVPRESKLGQQYYSTVARFWNYHRREGFGNVASLGAYVTSQFTHSGLLRLVIDSLVLIGVASTLGSAFNRRTFFAVYVFGGFLAAAADCAWARITSPCRSLTQVQLDQVLTSARLINEAQDKATQIAVLQLSTMRGFVELLTNTGEFPRKSEELKKQRKVIEAHYPQVRDWDKWTRPNFAASGSLVCLCMPPARRGVCSVLFRETRLYLDTDVPNI